MAIKLAQAQKFNIPSGSPRLFNREVKDDRVKQSPCLPP
jgi:hypothetical protein